MKPASFIAAIAMALAVGIVASAQNYSIRVTHNTNIRAEPSLSGARLSTAAAGTTVEVIGKQGRWLQVNRHGGAWLAGWVSHVRVESAADTTPTTTATAPVDNCCGIDRACHTDQQWQDGYWAYQRGDCQAPASASPASQPAAPATTSTPTDNCCGIDRQCHSDQDWINGYWAYQRGQCQSQSAARPGVDNCCQTGWDCGPEHEWIFGHWQAQYNRCLDPFDRPPNYGRMPLRGHEHIRIIELSDGFGALARRGLNLLQTRAPHWHAYVANAITEIREKHECCSGVQGASGKTSFHHLPYAYQPVKPQDDHTMAEFLVHEACHVYQAREERGVGGPNGWLNEYECEIYRLDFMLMMGGVSWNLHGTDEFRADPTNPAHWWW